MLTYLSLLPHLQHNVGIDWCKVRCSAAAGVVSSFSDIKFFPLCPANKKKEEKKTSPASAQIKSSQRKPEMLKIQVSLVCIQRHIPVMINTKRLITRTPQALFKDTAAVLFSAFFLRLNGGNNNHFSIQSGAWETRNRCPLVLVFSATSRLSSKTNAAFFIHHETAYLRVSFPPFFLFLGAFLFCLSLSPS